MGTGSSVKLRSCEISSEDERLNTQSDKSLIGGPRLCIHSSILRTKPLATRPVNNSGRPCTRHKMTLNAPSSWRDIASSGRANHADPFQLAMHPYCSPLINRPLKVVASWHIRKGRPTTAHIGGGCPQLKTCRNAYRSSQQREARSLPIAPSQRSLPQI